MTVDTAANQSRSPGIVATGGVAFDQLSAGVTNVTAAIDGLIPAPGSTRVVTVTP